MMNLGSFQRCPNQRLIQILLNKLGLNSTIVSNGQEAVDIYKFENQTEAETFKKKKDLDLII